MSVINATPLLAAAGGDYQISRSVRLRSSASGYLSRTFSNAATNNLKGSLSIWTKRGTLGAQGDLISCYNGSSSASTDLYFNTSNQLQFDFGNTAANSLITTAVYRDPSAWYHIHLEVDTTQATASNRVKLYVNGVQVTAFGTANYPAQNTVFQIVSVNANNRIGTNWNNSGAFFDGYLTEVNFIDGQALTPSSFGETDILTGVWKPKKYAGTYGTNGFYLNFSDNSSNTATTIGKDNSGNGNNWTPNNISVTSGVTYDSMLDVPTLYADGGNGRGNYCTLNPVDNVGGATFSNGNLQAVTGNAAIFGGRSTVAVSSGKFYWEMTPTNNVAGAGCSIGIDSITTPITSSGTALGGTATSYAYRESGQKVNSNTNTSYGASYTTNDVIGVALDLDAGTLVFYKNNSSQGTAFTGLSGSFTPSFADTGGAQGVTINANFGQRPFAYTPPTGFKALNTQNLPEPTIKKGNQYFDATLATGNPSGGTVVNSGFQPSLIWRKTRDISQNHGLYDSVRGGDRELISNATSAESTNAALVTSFNSNGFTYGNALASANSYVFWQWKESASSGFDIVTYSGTGAAQTVAHSLGVAPRFIIAKRRNAAVNWFVGSGALPSWSYALEGLNTTAAANSGATAVWNATAPTSSVFSVGTDLSASGGTYVAYVFAEVAGFSKFGSYTGNGSADGPFVFTGFRPRYVMIKRTDAVEGWYIYDTARTTINVMGAELRADSSAAESDFSSRDFLSNGFKVRTANGSVNASGGTYIFMAFAESPFKTSLAR